MGMVCLSGMTSALSIIGLDPLWEYVVRMRRANGGKKGGRPKLTPQQRAQIIWMKAEGSSNDEIEAAVGVSWSSIRRVVKAEQEPIKELQNELSFQIAGKVLTTVEQTTGARITDASDPSSKTGAQSYRSLMEAAGIIGKGRSAYIHHGDNHFHGDVNVNTQHVDARSLHMHSSSDDRSSRMDELRRKLNGR